MNLKTVNKIIKDEIKHFIHEQINHEEIRDIVDISSRMLSLLNKFDDIATKPMQDSIGQEMDVIKKKLEEFISNPQSYLSMGKEIVVKKRSKTHDLVIREPSGTKVVKRKYKKENVV